MGLENKKSRCVHYISLNESNLPPPPPPFVGFFACGHKFAGVDKEMFSVSGGSIFSSPRPIITHGQAMSNLRDLFAHA